MNVSDLNPILVEAMDVGKIVIIEATKLDSSKLSPFGNRIYFNENMSELLRRLNPGYKGEAHYRYYSLQKRIVTMSNSKPLDHNCIHLTSDEIFKPLEDIDLC